jgi:hypothetical protein
VAHDDVPVGVAVEAGHDVDVFDGWDPVLAHQRKSRRLIFAIRPSGWCHTIPSNS